MNGYQNGARRRRLEIAGIILGLLILWSSVRTGNRLRDGGGGRGRDPAQHQGQHPSALEPTPAAVKVE